MKPGIGVGIMVLKDNKILLGLRKTNKDKNTEIDGYETWSMPGGKVEYLEKLVDAAKRELKEETTIEALDIKLISINDDIVEQAHYVTIGFLVTSFKGEAIVTEPDKNIDWQWFDLNNLPNNLYSPSKNIIHNYLNNLIYKY